MRDSLIRIEKKLDELLRIMRDKEGAFLQALHHSGQVCPLCSRPVEYVDDGDGPYRVCGCYVKTKEV